MNDAVVSFNNESLILVDEHDQELGHQDKLTCHSGKGLLHRAFSIFIFNSEGKMLLQQRSAEKKLWPLFWSNSCCSHPRQGETMAIATQRRLQQELGFITNLQYLYKFKYHVPYLDEGSEFELCWVFVGQSDQTIHINKNEIANCRFISGRELELEMQQIPEQFTPWFKLEWERLKHDYLDVLKKLKVQLS